MHTFHALKKSCPLRIKINKTCSIISRSNTQYSASCALAQVPLGMIPLYGAAFTRQVKAGIAQKPCKAMDLYHRQCE